MLSYFILLVYFAIFSPWEGEGGTLFVSLQYFMMALI
jgi:hypothetical protein